MLDNDFQIPAYIFTFGTKITQQLQPRRIIKRDIYLQQTNQPFVVRDCDVPVKDWDIKQIRFDSTMKPPKDIRISEESQSDSKM